MNELGTSGEQIDSFWESNLDWIFAEKFSHTICENTQVFKNVSAFLFTILETRTILERVSSRNSLWKQDCFLLFVLSQVT